MNLRNGEGTGTIFQAGYMKEDNMSETIYFMLEGNGSDVPVTFNDNRFFNEYLKEKPAISYVEWLEKELDKISK